MTVPPPLDPILLREHAYQDTKILRLAFINDNNHNSFQSLYQKGLGSFDYQFYKHNKASFKPRDYDLNSMDPNQDNFYKKEIKNKDENFVKRNQADNLVDGIFNIISFLTLGLLILFVAKKLWKMTNGSKSSIIANKNYKHLQLNNPYYYNNASKYDDEELRIENNSSLPSLINTPKLNDGLKRNSSLISTFDEESLKTPISSSNNISGFAIKHKGLGLDGYNLQTINFES